MFAAIFSGITPYIMAGFLFVSSLVGGYALYERAEVADARSTSATLGATVNELQAAHDQDHKLIVDLQHMREIAEAVIVDQASRSSNVQFSLSSAETKVSHVKVTDCQTPDARDAVALDGLRNIVAASTPDHSDGGGQGTPAPIPAGVSAQP